MPLPISAYIITLNEEAALATCLDSLADMAEIVVVDSGSTDGTEALVARYRANGFPIRFLSEPWRGYAGQKQFALDQCQQRWCLNIDADERLDKALREKLPELVAAPADIVGWRVARRPYLIGYGYTPPHVHERRNLRLIRRGHGRYDLAQKVHEGLVPDGTVNDCPVGSLLHFRPLILDEQILKENAYSTLKADQQIAEGRPLRPWKLLFNPPAYFLRLYLHNGLWRCGWPGFIQAMTGGVYAFLTEAKLHQRHALRQRPNIDDGDGSSRAPDTTP